MGSVKRKCCCGGGCGGTCSFFGVGTPSCPNVRVVFAGTSINCCASRKADATNFDGTYTLTANAGCQWEYSSGSGASDDLNIKTYTPADCSGSTVADHTGYNIIVTIEFSGGIAVVRVEFTNGWFSGQVALGSCSGPFTVNNGTNPDAGTFPHPASCNSSGTATVTFCV